MSTKGAFWMLAVAAGATLALAATPAQILSQAEPYEMLPGSYDTVGLILKSQQLYRKTLVITPARIDCPDDIRCFLRESYPFDYVITIGISSLSPEDHRLVLLKQSDSNIRFEITGTLLGDIVDAVAIRKVPDEVEYHPGRS